MKTIHFCTQEDIERYKRIDYLKDYLTKKSEEMEELTHTGDPNRSALTNIGTFRVYIEEYLKHNAKVHPPGQGYMFLVRQLKPTETGLPIEIYVFSNDIRFTVYEKVQADIFDHLLAIIPFFGLEVFQLVSGKDLDGISLFSQGASPAVGGSDLPPA